MSLGISFLKMHGLGNDFVIIDTRIEENAEIKLSQPKRVKICDRHFGIGCDQLILLKKPKDADNAHIFMEIYNANGEKTTACGNAARCVAWLLLHHEQFYTPSAGSIFIETDSGILEAFPKASKSIEIRLPEPKFHWEDIPLNKALKTDQLSFPKFEKELGKGFAVNVGNPHLIFFVKDIEKVDVSEIGAHLEIRKLFPEKTNVEFAQIISDKEIEMKVWERGCGETLACGTGAAAVAVAAIKKGLVKDTVNVCMPGGKLKINWRENNPVHLSGNVELVFEGKGEF